MRDARGDDAAAVIVAGGEGTRMGGVDKPGLELGGATLRDRAIQAARSAGCEPVVVVGREVGGGPVAALDAGLEALTATEVVVLAGDLARPGLAIAALGGAETRGRDGIVLVDPGGHEQWLVARYRTESLRAAIARLPDGPAGSSLRAVLRDLDLARVSVDAETVADIDTWEDYETAKEHVDG